MVFLVIQQPNVRLSNISGHLIQFDVAKRRGRNATLDTKLNPCDTVTIKLIIRDMMGIQGDLLCYKYKKLYV